MRATTQATNIPKVTVNTKELMEMLGCGRPVAVEVGTQAHAKIKIRKRVLWNVKKVQKYLDEISE